jgi:hypothetical protein
MRNDSGGLEMTQRNPLNSNIQRIRWINFLAENGDMHRRLSPCWMFAHKLDRADVSGNWS